MCCMLLGMCAWMLVTDAFHICPSVCLSCKGDDFFDVHGRLILLVLWLLLLRSLWASMGRAGFFANGSGPSAVKSVVRAGLSGTPCGCFYLHVGASGSLGRKLGAAAGGAKHVLVRAHMP